MEKAIIGYHKDEKNDWVAELTCGHNQHVRHNPPWTLRPWVISEEGRRIHLGDKLDCKKCDRNEPKDFEVSCHV